MDLFQNPWMLLWMLLFLVIAAALEYWSASRREQLLAAFGKSITVSRLYSLRALDRRRLRSLLQFGGVAFLFLALAAPQWGIELVTGITQGTQVIVAIDTSLSMLTEDVKPNRIGKAQSELVQLLNALKGNRVGVIAFAGEAHVQCPLTTDMEAVRMFLDLLKVGMIPQPGTAIGGALDLGTKMLSKYPGHKAIVILSDGEDHVGHMLESARHAAAAGIHVYIVGIGTPDGEPIPIKDDQGHTVAYKKDSKGGTVISKLGESGLIQLAAASSGAYYRSTPEETEAFEIARHISELEKSRMQSGSSNRYKNRYRLPLAIAILLLLMELLFAERIQQAKPGEAAFRDKLRKTLGAFGAEPRNTASTKSSVLGLLILMALMPMSFAGCGYSQANMDLWKGNKSYRSEDFPKAIEKYVQAMNKNPRSPKPIFNIGDAQYKQGDLEKAQQAFSALADPRKVPPSLASKAFYNLGNTNFKKQNYKEALEDYKRCLLLDNRDEDCRYNLIKTLQQLKQPPQSKQQQKDKNQNQKNKNQDKQQNQGDQKNPAKPRPESGMTQEDAQRIMQAVQEKEKNALKPQPPWQKNSKPPQNPGDDW